MPPSKATGEEDPFGLRPNAAVSLVKAAKASLKEPTRPVTPSDYGRQLFANDDASNRPSTSYATASSRQFYNDNGPKLALPKLDSSRPDAGGSPTLRRVPSRGSDRDRETSRLATIPANTAVNLGVRPARQTAAETVASLKANITHADQDFSFHRKAIEPIPIAPPVEPTSRPPSGPTAASLHHHRPSSSGDGSQALAFHVEGEGPSLDPRRNDDLPPRPSTSRGRPGSATYGEMDPIHITERYHGLPAGVQDMGNGAQVLDISAFAQYSDDDDNDFDGGGAAGSGGSASVAAAAAPPPQQPAPRPPASVSAPSSSAAASPAKPEKQRRSGGAGAGAGAGAAPAVLDPSDAFQRWRGDVESGLAHLSATISGSASTAQLFKGAARLSVLVEDVRKQEHSSRWLNSGSATYRDGSGTPLTMREAILEHTFRLMDSTNTELLVKACAIVLRVVKARQPLLQTAKLLYRMSKDSSHDALFRREGLLEPLIHTVHIMVASAKNSSSPTHLHEPMIYINGCLKNISNDASNQKALIKLGTLHVLAALLELLAAQVEADSQASLLDSCGQVAVQASGVLRNLAVPAQSSPAFVVAGVVPAMRAACKVLWQHQEVVLNFGRVLSKLSLHEGCQAALESDPQYAPLLVRLLGQYANNRAILLRIAFVLGNLTTYSNEYRSQVAAVPGALTTVVSTLETYALRDAPAATDKLAKAATREDCLVKVLRLTANLAIHPKVGPQLACQRVVADSLLRLLQRYSFEQADELVLNAVCALTNLSFYHSEGAFTNAVLATPPQLLMPHITPLLLCDNEEAVIEAARLYGNFSRSPEVRSYMQDSRVVEALVLLLDHSNPEVLYSVCGTLINFTMDPARKAALVGLGGVTRLVEVLGRTVALQELTDMEVGVVEVVCKALFNVAVDDNNSSSSPTGSRAASNGNGHSAGSSNGDVGSSSSGGAARRPAAVGCSRGFSFTPAEASEVLALITDIDGSPLTEVDGMAALLGRLAGLVRRLQEQLGSGGSGGATSELEPLPEGNAA